MRIPVATEESWYQVRQMMVSCRIPPQSIIRDLVLKVLDAMLGLRSCGVVRTYRRMFRRSRVRRDPFCFRLCPLDLNSWCFCIERTNVVLVRSTGPASRDGPVSGSHRGWRSLRGNRSSRVDRHHPRGGRMDTWVHGESVETRAGSNKKLPLSTVSRIDLWSTTDRSQRAPTDQAFHRRNQPPLPST